MDGNYIIMMSVSILGNWLRIMVGLMVIIMSFEVSLWLVVMRVLVNILSVVWLNVGTLMTSILTTVVSVVT